MSGKLFITIAGNIGTGKTTLTKMLADHYGWKAHFEAVQENPYLADFYADMSRWSFPLQIFFLTHRFKVHKGIAHQSGSAIQDRSIFEDCHIFARNLYESGKMEKRDYFNYIDLYQQMTPLLDPPDLMIYLRKDVTKLMSQIRKRARDFEMSIPEDYISCLNRYYDEWIGGYTLGKLLVIDSNELDFVANPEHFDKIAKQVFEKLDQQELFLPLARVNTR
jgi:deoxyadenosine/deoxycytidine kinase